MKTYNSPSTAYAPTHGGYPGQHPADAPATHGDRHATILSGPWGARSSCCGQSVSRPVPGVGSWLCDNCGTALSATGA